MKGNKINIDALPCKISWTTPLLLICIMATIAAIVCRKMSAPDNPMTGTPGAFADFALGINSASAILWIVFFALFANACKHLHNQISTATMFMALTGAFASVATCVSSLYGNPVIGIIGIIFWIACLGGVLWLGNALSNNYVGTLEEIGLGLKKIVKLAIAIAIIMLVYLILGIILNPISDSIVLGFAIFSSIILGIWMMWIMLDDVVLPIYQMLNWGNQEKVSQDDMQKHFDSIQHS